MQPWCCPWRPAAELGVRAAPGPTAWLPRQGHPCGPKWRPSRHLTHASVRHEGHRHTHDINAITCLDPWMTDRYTEHMWAVYQNTRLSSALLQVVTGQVTSAYQASTSTGAYQCLPDMAVSETHDAGILMLIQGSPERSYPRGGTIWLNPQNQTWRMRCILCSASHDEQM